MEFKEIRGKSPAELNKLLEELLKYAGKYDKKPVLFPTDDYTTSVMDLNRSVLEEHFIMPTIVGGGDGCLTHHMDKRPSLQRPRS